MNWWRWWGGDEFDDNADDDDDDDDDGNNDENAREEDENEEGEDKDVESEPVPAPKPADGDAADDEMLNMNYWDDDNPWSRGRYRGEGSLGGPGGEGVVSDGKFQGFQRSWMVLAKGLKQEQLQLAQASFRNL